MLARPVSQHKSPRRTSSNAGQRRTLPCDNSSSAESGSRPEINGNASLLQQVEPYRLITAKFPIDRVTTVWSRGRNRPINDAHCEQLRKAFRSGLHREDPQNYLRLACQKVEVDRMVSHLLAQGQSTSSDVRRSWVDFTDWAEVNPSQAELMAGAHRVKALKAFLKSQGEEEADQSERWWICVIYDKGGSLIHFRHPVWR
jgi:hypothetical protein